MSYRNNSNNYGTVTISIWKTQNITVDLKFVINIIIVITHVYAPKLVLEFLPVELKSEF